MSGFHGNHAAQLISHLVCPKLIEADARAQQTFFRVKGSYVVAGETAFCLGSVIFLIDSVLLRGSEVCRVKVNQFGELTPNPKKRPLRSMS